MVDRGGRWFLRFRSRLVRDPWSGLVENEARTVQLQFPAGTRESGKGRRKNVVPVEDGENNTIELRESFKVDEVIKLMGSSSEHFCNRRIKAGGCRRIIRSIPDVLCGRVGSGHRKGQKGQKRTLLSFGMLFIFINLLTYY